MAIWRICWKSAGFFAYMVGKHERKSSSLDTPVRPSLPSNHLADHARPTLVGLLERVVECFVETNKALRASLGLDGPIFWLRGTAAHGATRLRRLHSCLRVPEAEIWPCLCQWLCPAEFKFTLNCSLPKLAVTSSKPCKSISALRSNARSSQLASGRRS